jgi:hypothetical protein
MANKITPPQLPVVEMLTGEEVQEALSLYALQRKGWSAPDAAAELKLSTAQVSFRNVKLPDGCASLFATVGVFKPVPVEPKDPTATPLPKEANG